MQLAQEILGRPLDPSDQERTLAELGFDSLAIAEFLTTLEGTFGVAWSEGETAPMTLPELYSQFTVRCAAAETE